MGTVEGHPTQNARCDVVAGSVPVGFLCELLVHFDLKPHVVPRRKAFAGPGDKAVGGPPVRQIHVHGLFRTRFFQKVTQTRRDLCLCGNFRIVENPDVRFSRHTAQPRRKSVDRQMKHATSAGQLFDVAKQRLPPWPVPLAQYGGAFVVAEFFGPRAEERRAVGGPVQVHNQSGCDGKVQFC